MPTKIPPIFIDARSETGANIVRRANVHEQRRTLTGAFAISCDLFHGSSSLMVAEALEIRFVSFLSASQAHSTLRRKQQAADHVIYGKVDFRPQ
jgi:hypothetical protein